MDLELRWDGTKSSMAGACDPFEQPCNPWNHLDIRSTAKGALQNGYHALPSGLFVRLATLLSDLAVGGMAAPNHEGEPKADANSRDYGSHRHLVEVDVLLWNSSRCCR